MLEVLIEVQNSIPSLRSKSVLVHIETVLKNEIYNEKEIQTKLWYMQHSTKLQFVHRLLLNLWSEHNWSYTLWVNDLIVGKTKSNSHWCVVAKSVFVGHHMRSGPCVCSSEEMRGAIRSGRVRRVMHRGLTSRLDSVFLCGCSQWKTIWRC